MRDVNNFVIDRIIRGVMTSTSDGSYLWGLNQITNPQLSMTSETVDAVDAVGTTIMTFERSKAATFSGENSVFDLGLLAAQTGSEKEYGTDGTSILAETFETIDVSGTTVELAHTPVGEIARIYVLNADSTIGKEYKAGASATANEFKITGKSIELPTTVTSGQVFVMYQYNSNDAVRVVNKATEFPKAGKFVLEILGADACDPTALIHAYLVFPTAKLSSNTDLTFSTDMTQAFEINCQQSYCSQDKELWYLVIAE